jgi:hypothetical protein
MYIQPFFLLKHDIRLEWCEQFSAFPKIENRIVKYYEELVPEMLLSGTLVQAVERLGIVRSAGVGVSRIFNSAGFRFLRFSNCQKLPRHRQNLIGFKSSRLTYGILFGSNYVHAKG